MDQQSVDKDFFRSRVRRWSWRFGGGEVVDQQSVDKDGLATLVSELLHTHTPYLPDGDEKKESSWIELDVSDVPNVDDYYFTTRVCILLYIFWLTD